MVNWAESLEHIFSDIEEKFAILKGSIYATNTSNIKYFFQLIQKKSLQDFFFFIFLKKFLALRSIKDDASMPLPSCHPYPPISPHLLAWGLQIFFFFFRIKHHKYKKGLTLNVTLSAHYASGIDDSMSWVVTKQNKMIDVRSSLDLYFHVLIIGFFWFA